MKNSIQQEMKESIQKVKGMHPECCDTTSSKVAKEKGKRFEINCKNNYYLKIRIDDCIVKSKVDRKCDYLFIRNYECKEGETEFYFVEFKGSDIERAFSQVVNAINYIKNNHITSLSKENTLGFIISSKVPSGGTDVGKLKQVFRKKYGRNLEVKNRNLVYAP